jgi:hypothetical protein
MGRVCSTNGDKRKAYRLSVENVEGKRPLGKSRYKRVDNIKIDR